MHLASILGTIHSTIHSTIPITSALFLLQVQKSSPDALNVLDLRHHIRSGYSSVAGKLGPFRGCKLQG
jgi:hypothetical protein